jgi:hypothetical protein
MMEIYITPRALADPRAMSIRKTIRATHANHATDIHKFHHARRASLCWPSLPRHHAQASAGRGRSPDPVTRLGSPALRRVPTIPLASRSDTPTGDSGLSFKI